ncbi:MAG: hypothetical protein K2X55_21500 [Burkholderiaceae bacterium]|nr:hypothetical protein [Burkholderiaceae bacterium]
MMTNTHRIDFRATAVDLAAKLQHAERGTLLLQAELQRAQQTISIMKKHMTLPQRLHAQFELDDNSNAGRA